MRHHYAGRKLSRDRDHRKALFKNLIRALILHGEIKTTEAKAKAIRSLFEKLVTKANPQTLHARRLVAAFLQNKKVVNKLVDELAPLFKKRKGGFTRIIRLGERRGDKAMMVKLELVEKPKVEETKKKKKGRKKQNENQSHQKK